jgi:hypothetical protein
MLVTSATALAIAGAAAPADASVGIRSFSITPSTTQAGASPNLKVNINLANSWSDTADNLTLSFAQGLLANPQVPATCSVQQFSWDSCPSSSWIGNGTVTVSIPAFFGFTAPVGANVYLVTPTNSSSVARIGLIINVLGIPLESALAPVTVGRPPNPSLPSSLGLNFNFSGLPNNWNGLGLQIDNINLTIFGSVNGKAFTRNPTTCSAATSAVYANSYQAQATYSSGTSAFTPTNCGSLTYSPSITASSTLDTGDSGASYTTSISQTATGATTQSVTVVTPPALSPNLAAAALGCSLTPLSSCPSIGTATATTPFLSQPLAGTVVLVAHGGALPTPAIVFTSPVPLTLNGTDSISLNPPQTLTATFNGIPDIPLTNLTVTFNGGANGLFRALPTAICPTATNPNPQPTVASFTADNGLTSQQTANTTIIGCPAS